MLELGVRLLISYLTRFLLLFVAFALVICLVCSYCCKRLASVTNSLQDSAIVRELDAVTVGYRLMQLHYPIDPLWL